MNRATTIGGTGTSRWNVTLRKGTYKYVCDRALDVHEGLVHGQVSKLRLDITMSLDGFVAGPNATLEDPLGKGGMRLHEWAFAAASWREQHGLSGGEANADSDVIQESLDSLGAVLMARRMFSGGEGPWADDPNANGWWGDDAPYEVPVFVLTHHAREPLHLRGGSFTFVTDGIEAALAQATRWPATRMCSLPVVRASRSSTSLRACSTSCRFTSSRSFSATASGSSIRSTRLSISS